MLGLKFPTVAYGNLRSYFKYSFLTSYRLTKKKKSLFESTSVMEDEFIKVGQSFRSIATSRTF